MMATEDELGFINTIFTKDINGKWVKHEDILKEMRELSKRAFADGVNSAQGDVKKQLEKVYHDGFFAGYDFNHSGIGNDPKTRVECNCIKYLYSDPRTDIQSTEIFWICPAHGYKKR